MKKTFLTMALVLAAGFLSPAFAQEAARGGGHARRIVAQWSIITAGFALAFAAAFGALGQGKAVSAAVEGIARNPSAAGDIRGALILGLVLIESLVIYGCSCADPVPAVRSAEPVPRLHRRAPTLVEGWHAHVAQSLFQSEARFAALHARRPGFFRLRGPAVVRRRATVGIPTSTSGRLAHKNY